MDISTPLKEVSGAFLPFLDNIPAVRLLLAFLLVFFLPGFAWALVFFKALKPVEIIAVSIGLSIALVTLSILFTSLVFGTRINGLNAVVTIVFITVLPVAGHYLLRYARNKMGRAAEK